MKVRSKISLIALTVAAALSAQDAAAPVPERQEPGAIEGLVRNNATGQPLRRAQVVLTRADTHSSARFQETSQDGKFSFPSLPPGRYSIAVERDGFLPLSAARLGSYKMPPVFTLRPGETISGLDFSMLPGGVISGRVKFDDAEAAMNVPVQLYRGFFNRGRRGYAMVASGLTNDRGEYRLGGLAPGTYYVAALYRARSHPTDAEEQPHKNPAGSLMRDLSYATTFFPQTQTMADAVAVGVQPGEEVSGIDIFLTLVRTVRIRGRVLSALSGQTVQAPGISLRWNDPANTGSVTTPTDVTFDKDLNFEIKGVPPGQYWLTAAGSDDGTTLTARAPLNVIDQDIDDLNLALSPEVLWNGKVQVNGENPPALNGIALSFEPRRATASPLRAEVSEKGDFKAALWPNETYDLYLANAPEDVYLSSVRLANTEHIASGLEVEPGETPPPVEVVLSTNGGQVTGQTVTTDSMIVASGATLALIPDPPDGRFQSYKSTFADEYGNFQIRGIAPGRYILLAWMDQPPCDPYNPEDLPACRAHGTALAIPEGGGQNVQITVN